MPITHIYKVMLEVENPDWIPSPANTLAFRDWIAAPDLVIKDNFKIEYVEPVYRTVDGMLVQDTGSLEQVIYQGKHESPVVNKIIRSNYKPKHLAQPLEEPYDSRSFTDSPFARSPHP